MKNVTINHLAVVVCIILIHGLGFLWYGPLFGEKWMAHVGYTAEEMQADGSGAGIWVLNSVSIIAAVYLLAWLFAKLNVTSGMTGALYAFVITFSIHHLAVMNANMFAGDPYGLAWITGGYTLAANTLAGFILGAWVKYNGGNP